MAASATTSEIAAAALTHPGCRRPNNEDAFLARPELGLFAVCDGMGGHHFGEVASRLAIDAIADEFAPRLAAESGAPIDPDDALCRAILAAHERVAEESAARELTVHMGTTAVAALVRGGEASIAHVGDSRAYLVARDGRRVPLTRDHTVARLYAQAGLISEAAVAEHPLRGVLVRCLGAPDGCEVDRMRVRIGRGDRLVLCSDGLTEMVEEAEILDLTAEGIDPDSIARALLAAALAGGGEDNVTVLVVERR